MALIFCPECGTQVSEHAQQCIKCAYPIYKLNGNVLEGALKKGESKTYNIAEPQQQTDLFAIISFAAGLGGFVILPILFVPIGYIAAIIFRYRLKENKQIKGKGLGIIGAILNTINILWLMYQYKTGFFRN